MLHLDLNSPKAGQLSGNPMMAAMMDNNKSARLPSMCPQSGQNHKLLLSVSFCMKKICCARFSNQHWGSERGTVAELSRRTWPWTETKQLTTFPRRGSARARERARQRWLGMRGYFLETLLLQQQEDEPVWWARRQRHSLISLGFGEVVKL